MLDHFESKSIVNPHFKGAFSDPFGFSFKVLQFLVPQEWLYFSDHNFEF